MGYSKKVFIVVLVFFGVLGLYACKDSSTSGINESLEFIRSVEPIQGAQNVTIDLKDGHDRGAYFEVDLSGIESNPYISNGTKQAWCIEWDVPANRGNQEGVKLHSTKGQELWREVNYFLSQKDQLQEEFPGLGWKESQIIIWSLVKHKEFDIDEIPNYQGFDNDFYEEGEYLFDVELAKEIISRVNASSQKLAEDSFAIIVENEGQTVIIDGEEVLVGTAKIGSEGGKIISNDGNILIEIPSGALTSAETIKISKTEDLPIVQSGLEISGDYYSFEPHGIVFEEPIRVTWDLNDISEDIDLSINEFPAEIMQWSYDGDIVTIIDADIDEENKSMSFQISKFSVFTFLIKRGGKFYITPNSPEEEWAVWTHKWGIENIDWFIDEASFTYASGFSYLKEDVIKEAFNKWEKVSPLRFNQTNNKSNAQFVFKDFGRIEDELVTCALKGAFVMFFDPLGYACFDIATFSSFETVLEEDNQYEIYLNSKYIFENYGTVDKINNTVLRTLTHEIGHALALFHIREKPKDFLDLPIMYKNNAGGTDW